ncbi:MAG TPA: glutathione peroxidase [Termitinemataceae bacterium]|nr:glutathione peroxidase [Termitinemataceae bacterium]HOM22332.1 glutathione peroxidase [Termitinemataceae bacterium]HPP99246.1 glutathione peroxidase [Termitinemataceae bacterium]
MDSHLYNLTALTNKGTPLSLSQYKGKVLLIVNTASKCGFTPQYKGLQRLYEKYRDRGFEILAFPCDQFAHQEPGNNEEIAQFCQTNFGVTFPLMSKIEVNGPNTHPVFAWIKKKAPGLIGESIKWNFTKFLVSRDGTKVTRYAPTVEPASLELDIEKALSA